MKFLRTILSIFLIFAVVNTFTAKAIHEFFDHQEKVEYCVNKDITHFHEFELLHQDLICSFNIATSFLTDFLVEFKNTIRFFNNVLQIEFIQLTQDLFHHHFRLRGPPFIK